MKFLKHRILSLAVILTASFLVQAHDLIAITEILKDPWGKEDEIPGGKSHEFIEFTNFGTTSFSLDSLFVSDGAVSDSLIQFQSPLPTHPNCPHDRKTLSPGETALILCRDYPLAPLDSKLPIDSGTIVLTVNKSRLLGSGISANDGCFLYKGTRTEISRVIAVAADSDAEIALGASRIEQTGSKGHPEGVSVIPSSVLFSPPQWIESPEGISPGHFERITSTGWLAEYQLGIASGQSVVCSLAILQATTSPQPSSWSLQAVPLSDPATIIAQDILPALQEPYRTAHQLPFDTIQYRICIGQACWNIDLSPLWIPSQAIKISELFPRALPDIPEWIELVNLSSIPIDISGWIFGSPEDAETLGTTPVVLPPHEYRVLTQNKQRLCSTYAAIEPLVIQPPRWRALSNSTDTISLWDRHGNLVETAAYMSSWFDTWDRGSLERIDFSTDPTLPGAWVVSDPPSPGMKNLSISFRSTSLPKMSIGPRPFTPNGDGIDDELLVTIALPPEYSLELEIYGFDGRQVWVFPDSPRESYRWNGRTQTGSLAPPGPFFVIATFQKGTASHRIRKKGVLWR